MRTACPPGKRFNRFEPETLAQKSWSEVAWRKSKQRNRLFVPGRFGPKDLPIGVQLVGPFGADAEVLSVGQWVEMRLSSPDREVPIQRFPGGSGRI